MEKLKAGSGNVPALMFTMPEVESKSEPKQGAKAYTPTGADIQRKAALLFLSNIYSVSR